MRLIIAGSRRFTDMAILEEALEHASSGGLKGFLTEDITEVVWGGAPGADQLGKDWADAHGVKVMPFPADWTKYGHDAGKIRNEKMAKYGDMLIAIWDYSSPGTRDMRKRMFKEKKPVFTYVPKIVPKEKMEKEEPLW